MKVLFICYANVGRSQVAHAYFEKLSKHDCESAGLAVTERLAAMKLTSKKLKDNPNQSSLRYLKRELDRDIGEKEKQQLVPEMITRADLVVVIAEKERWPSYLQGCNKLLFWDIQDPVGMTDESADQVYREVRRRVEELVAEIG